MSNPRVTSDVRIGVDDAVLKLFALASNYRVDVLAYHEGFLSLDRSSVTTTPLDRGFDVENRPMPTISFSIHFLKTVVLKWEPLQTAVSQHTHAGSRVLTNPYGFGLEKDH